MEAITIHPKSVKQLKTVKAVLRALSIPFEPQSASLPEHVSKSIRTGLKQLEEGQSITLEEFKNKHFK
ncbi:MAG: hypothetical protein J0L67_15785 [Cytophagales bacterium]|nr:hypothetical protein [Cytophagales bacterium]